jgi:hypothetical protein
MDQYEYQNEADRVAKLHLLRIKRYLARKGKSYNLKNIGWIWNAGFGSFSRNRMPERTRNHIKKLEREYWRIKNN